MDKSCDVYQTLAISINIIKFAAVATLYQNELISVFTNNMPLLSSVDVLRQQPDRSSYDKCSAGNTIADCSFQSV